MNKKRFLTILVIVSSVYFLFQLNKENTKVEVVNVVEEIKNDSIISTNSDTQLDFLLPKPTSNQIVEHTKFVLSYNEEHEQAEWVAYRLNRNSINNSIKRKDNFRGDPKVITESATLLDYKNSGYDRGHLAPAKAMSFNKFSMSESFYMSNMSPQKPSFNRGIWKKLEEQVRRWILVSDSLYVVTGPVLDKPLGKIGKNEVTVPRAYYKTILRFKNSTIKGIGFLLENVKSNNSVFNFAISIDSLEKITQLDFYHLLDDVIENQIEQNSSIDDFLKDKTY